MKILDLHHAQITIPLGMETVARHFYCTILGLTEIPKPHSLKKRGGFWLLVGDKQVHIGVEDGVNRSSTKAHLAYLVDDLSECRNQLNRHQIPTLDSIPIPGYERLELRDPFGNRIELIQAI
ncbi:VOC family protein [Hazenella coriacea]|uniref:Glyoxalase/bleomycin resistance protein/dioxygenase superfamily protein n=1 Tax=Hazenella coriacea TaxID=1179467 RepID=A0A4R3L9Z0_9BACL|nr:VOC family protein [Hazenella coriacea]TCS95960.1 glyoxalase/bleomycin resistance protein/dioxygenase superfamily protein [Hazenella coriacea]